LPPFSFKFYVNFSVFAFFFFPVLFGGGGALFKAMRTLYEIVPRNRTGLFLDSLQDHRKRWTGFETAIT